MPTVIIPPPYRGPTQGAAEVRVDGASVRACLEAVEREHPGFLAQVVDAQGSLHGFVRLFRNGERLDGDALGTRVGSGDQVEILAAIAGG